MIVLVVSHSATAFSYFVITYHLVNFLRDSNLTKLFHGSAESKPEFESESGIKRKLFFMMIALAALFASFIALCGLTHVLNVVDAFNTDLSILKTVQMTVLIACALVSVATAMVSYKIFPLVAGILAKFEMNSEGTLEHSETYLLEIVEMVKESIMVLSSDLKIVRKNQASMELFGSPNLLGKSVLDFVHPEDVRSFELFTASAMASYGESPMTIEYRVKPSARVAAFSRRTAQPAQSSKSGKSVKSGRTNKSSKSSKVQDEPVGDQASISGPAFSLTSSMASLRDDCAPQQPDYIWVESAVLKHMYTDTNEEIQYTLEMVTRNIDERKKQQQTQLATILKETEEQGRINSAKLRYLSCIAHDLKTPLQSFCYTLDLLLQTRLRAEQREFVQQANVAVDLMKLTISQTMDIGKALTGAKLMPRRTAVLLSSVIKRVEIIIAGFGKQVPVSIEKAPCIADEIITDEEWLWQMLLNLLTNACKYTDNGSITLRVSLSTPEEHLPDKPHDHPASALSQLLLEPGSAAPQMLLFEVIDTGVGVSPAKLPIMFDAFSQVQEGQATGTGLGLYGVRMRAEGLQGTCGARQNTESSTGTGTVMWFAIPYLPDLTHANNDLSISGFDRILGFAESPHSISSSSTKDYRAMNMRLLSPSDLARRASEILQSRPITAMVVEDTLTVRKLMERMLLQLGFAKVVGYDNGSKGLDAMMAEQVDIVFSDVQMPVMTGPEMVSRFRKFEAQAMTAGIRSERQVIVAVTANGSELSDNTNIGFDSVYPKPLGRNDIYKIINEYL